MLNRLSIGARLSIILVLVIVGIVAVSTLNLFAFRTNLLLEREANTTVMVQMASEAIQKLYQKSQRGEISESEAQKLALAQIALMRANDSYIWINDMNGVLLSHPSAEGKSLYDSRSPSGIFYMREFIETAKKGGGFVKYDWARKQDAPLSTKLSYVSLFAPWQWVIGNGIYLDDIDQTFIDNLLSNGVLSLFLLLAISFGVFVVGKSISKPIGKLTDAMTRLVNGDISCQVEGAEYSNAIGQLARAVLVFKQKEIEVRQLTDEKARAEARLNESKREAQLDSLNKLVSVGVGSGNVVIQIVRMKLSVDEACEQAQSMASAIEEMVTSIRSISESTQAVSNDSRNAEQTANTGLSLSKQGVHSMGQISQAADQASNEVNELATESAQIGEIVSQIDSIASQTNLLALNATIEAARAGDAGKGFAVVASEVKGLATQTGKATEDIQQRIESLRGRMASIVKSMQQSVSAVSDGKEVISGLGNQLEEISTQTKGVSTRMTDTASLLAQQTDAANYISKSSTAIAEDAKKNTSEIFNILKQMDSLNETVNKQIGTFADLGGRAIVEIAKNDHVSFKKNVADIMVGLKELAADKLSTHHTCRLGKWYDSISDESIRSDPAFIALAEPHQRVHDLGKEVLLLKQAGKRTEASEALERLNDASQVVIDKLEELSQNLARREAAAKQ